MGRKTSSKLPNETCERCRKVITARARANLIGNTIACTPCYKKYHATRNPPEKCGRCRKVIGRTARANLIGNTIACAPCYKKHQAERLPEEHCHHFTKVIGRRARANLIGEIIVCTPCLRKNQKAQTAQVKAKNPPVKARKPRTTRPALPAGPKPAPVRPLAA